MPVDDYRRGLTVLWLANAAHAYSISSVFSYAGFLAVDCGWAKDADHAGTVAGAVAAALPLGRVLTSTLWGVLSDRVGSKHALFLSMLRHAQPTPARHLGRLPSMTRVPHPFLLSIAAGNFCFGFAKSLPFAIACRGVLLGAFNGWSASTPVGVPIPVPVPIPNRIPCSSPSGSPPHPLHILPGHIASQLISSHRISYRPSAQLAPPPHPCLTPHASSRR